MSPSTARRLWLVFLAALLVGVLAAADAEGGKPAGADGPQPPGLARALAAQEQATPALLRKRAVVGTAVGLGDGGAAEIQVLTRRAGVRGVPASVGGVPVDVVVTGPLSPLHHRSGHGGGPPGGGGGDDGDGGGDDGGGEDPAPNLAPTDTWPRPVPIGVSTGRADECAAGTIGARVEDGAGNVFALSNNHVYAKENAASTGDEILQPGRYDLGCAEASPEHHLGTLYDFVPLDFGSSGENTVDAAIAATTTARLDNATPSYGYGTPSSSPLLGALDDQSTLLSENVQKFGRTTGLTSGLVTMVNASVSVGYGSGTALFTDQIVVERRKPGFLQSGDSGSLLVTDDTGKRPVGLLFAGNSNGKLAIANDIRDVLAELEVAIDGAP